MRYHFLILFLITLTITSCLDLEEESGEYHIYNEYELLFDYGEHSNNYYKRHLIDYFESIALGSEYGANLPFLRKWDSTIKIFIDDTPSSIHIEETKNVVVEINELFLDNHNVEIVNDLTASNLIMFFGEREDYKALFPESVKYLGSNIGFFLIKHDENFNIHEGHIFIDLKNTSINVQKHILREELTQSLGLPNDILHYLNSIFFQGPTSTTSYDNLDKEVIRLLYHPQLIAGLGQKSVSNILHNIL